MDRKIILLRACLLICLLNGLYANCHATTYYWVSSSLGYWSVSANWSLSSGGTSGAGAPGADDDVIFDSNGNGDCVVDDTSASITSLTISGYTGKVYIALTLTTTSASVSSGGIQGGTLILNGGVSTISNISLNSKLSGTCTTINLSNVNSTGAVSLTNTGSGPAAASFIQGVTFSQNVDLTNGGTRGLTLTNNTYNGTSVNWTRTNSGFIISDGGEVYNCPLTINNNSSGPMGVARSGATAFNGNLTLINTAGGTINFGANGGIGSLSAGNTITFSDNGTYNLKNFTQQGTGTPININFTTAKLSLSNCTFNSVFSLSAPTLSVNSNTFNNTASLTKTGPSFDIVEGNTFNSTATYTMSGTGGVLTLSSTLPDNYNGNLTINQTFGTTSPAYGSTATIKGDLTVTSKGPITFGAAGGSLVFTGTSGQTFSSTGSVLPTINTVTFNKSNGNVTLNSPFMVATSATFTSGIVTSSNTNYFQVNNSASVNSASNLSYVDGPVVKVGSQAFTFPVGNSSIYRPISISAPSATTDKFTASFFHSTNSNVNPSLYLSPLVTVSSCEYWTLSRMAGTSNVSATLSWYTPDCVGPYISDLTTLQVARYNGANWVSDGNGGTTGDTNSGTIVSNGTVGGFGTFALGSTTISNPLPIELTKFKAVAEGNAVNLIWETASELNNDYFKLERSNNGSEFKLIGTSKGAGTTNVTQQYTYIDESPVDGANYYRLSQVDYDGYIKSVGVAEITVDNQFVLYPNPTSHMLYLGKMMDIKMTDIFGKVFYQGVDVDSIDVSHFPPGIYIVISGAIAKRVVIGR